MVMLETLAKFWKPRDLNKELRAHMNIALRIEKLNGKVILEKDSDLVMRNLSRILYQLFANYATENGPSVTLTDQTGTGRSGSLGASTSWSVVREPLGTFSQGNSGDATTGIVIGSGTTSPTRLDYKLETQILTASITHNQQTYEEISDYSWRLNREFTNALVSLNVSESGILYNTKISTVGAYKLLWVRDTFTTIPVSIGNGVRIRYLWSF